MASRAASGSFVDASKRWGQIDEGPTRALLAVDLNDDGHPDIVRTTIGATTTIDLVAVYRSAHGSRSACSKRVPTPTPWGARIRVTTAEGRHTRWITAGSRSIFSGEPPEALFGLGDADAVETIEVVWPDGSMQTWPSISTRREIVLTRQP